MNGHPFEVKNPETPSANTAEPHAVVQSQVEHRASLGRSVSIEQNTSIDASTIDVNTINDHVILEYSNGDRYTGDCKFGKPDGFGEYYYKNKGTVTGFFALGKVHGIASYESKRHINKGTYREGIKYGIFYSTNKLKQETHKQKWYNDHLISNEITQYLSPDLLMTSRNNPRHQKKTKQINFKGVSKECIICRDRYCNATYTECGHVAMCYECLTQCDRCPICRKEGGRIIKLYLS